MTGRDWAMLSKAVGTKSLNQIKNFYYDYKKQKQAGKQRPPSDKKVNGSPKAGDSLDESAESKRAKIEAAPKAPNLAASPMEQETDLTGALRYSPQEEAVYNQQQGMESNLNAENLSSEIAATLPTSMLRNELDTGNRELIHQLLNQQLQQQKHQQQLEQHQQQQLQLGQQPQSAIQQLLSQQHHQREQQQQQQASQLSLEEARRMLQHQSHHQQVLSGLLPWVTASQVMQAQSRLPHALAAAALQQEGSLGSISDISDGKFVSVRLGSFFMVFQTVLSFSRFLSPVTSLQRLLQMQQASQNPYGVNQSSRPLSSLLMSGGLNPSASSGLPPSLLNRLEHLGGSAQGSTSDSAVENLSALARAQAGMLGYGGNSQRGAGEGSRPGGSNLGGSALFRQAGASPNMESAGVSDALSMLARSIPRAGDGSNHGFGGGMPDRKDGADRYNG